MSVRPYALLGARRVAALHSAVEAAAAGWAAAWGLAAPQVAVERAWEAAPHAASWRHARHGADGKGLWLAWPQDLAPQLQRAMFAPDKRHGPQGAAPAPVAHAAAEAALAALAEALGQALAAGAGATEQAEPPAQLSAYASGAAHFELRIGKLACHGLLNHTAVLAMSAAPVPATALATVNMAAALAAVPVTLQVGVGQAEVGLGNLLALAVGDVVRLDTSAERPLAVTDTQGQRLMGGHLGIDGNKLALEVVRG